MKKRNLIFLLNIILLVLIVSVSFIYAEEIVCKYQKNCKGSVQTITEIWEEKCPPMPGQCTKTPVIGCKNDNDCPDKDFSYSCVGVNVFQKKKMGACVNKKCVYIDVSSIFDNCKEKNKYCANGKCVQCTKSEDCKKPPEVIKSYCKNNPAITGGSMVYEKVQTYTGKCIKNKCTFTSDNPLDVLKENCGTMHYDNVQDKCTTIIEPGYTAFNWCPGALKPPGKGFFGAVISMPYNIPLAMERFIAQGCFGLNEWDTVFILHEYGGQAQYEMTYNKKDFCEETGSSAKCIKEKQMSYIKTGTECKRLSFLENDCRTKADCKPAERCEGVGQFPNIPTPGKCYLSGAGYKFGCQGTGTHINENVVCESNIEACNNDGMFEFSWTESDENGMCCISIKPIDTSNTAPKCISLGAIASTSIDSTITTMSTSVYMIRNKNNFSLDGLSYVITPSLKFNKPVEISLNSSNYQNKNELMTYKYSDHESVLEVCNKTLIDSITKKINSNGGIIQLDNRISLDIPKEALTDESSITIEEYDLSECSNVAKPELIINETAVKTSKTKIKEKTTNESLIISALLIFIAIIFAIYFFLKLRKK